MTDLRERANPTHTLVIEVPVVLDDEQQREFQRALTGVLDQLRVTTRGVRCGNAQVTLRGEMLTTREAARQIGVHENTIRNWIERGLIVPVALPSGVRRIPTEQIAKQVQRMRDEMNKPAPGIELDG